MLGCGNDTNNTGELICREIMRIPVIQYMIEPSGNDEPINLSIACNGKNYKISTPAYEYPWAMNCHGLILDFTPCLAKDLRKYISIMISAPDNFFIRRKSSARFAFARFIIDQLYSLRQSFKKFISHSRI